MENNNNFKICSFFGHRQIQLSEDLQKRITKILIDLIEKEGFNTFYFGAFGEFDELCRIIVTDLQKKYPYVQRIYCLEDEKYIRKRPRYLTKEEYDEFVYLPLSYTYWKTRIYYRNCAMIDNSDFIIFYAENKEGSGAYKAYKYAVQKKKKFINLFT